VTVSRAQLSKISLTGGRFSLTWSYECRCCSTDSTTSAGTLSLIVSNVIVVAIHACHEGLTDEQKKRAIICDERAMF
jgi:hypothetical protein